MLTRKLWYRSKRPPFWRISHLSYSKRISIKIFSIQMMKMRSLNYFLSHRPLSPKDNRISSKTIPLLDIFKNTELKQINLYFPITRMECKCPLKFLTKVISFTASQWIKCLTSLPSRIAACPNPRISTNSPTSLCSSIKHLSMNQGLSLKEKIICESVFFKDI